MRLEQWYAHYAGGTAYTAPELRGLAIVGLLVDHPLRPDGTRVKTSRVVSATGRTVRTQSGSVYELGDIDPAYRAYLDEQGILYDHEHPIKLVDAAQGLSTCEVKVRV
jgi:hypothetical protein